MDRNKASSFMHFPLFLASRKSTGPDFTPMKIAAYRVENKA